MQVQEHADLAKSMLHMSIWCIMLMCRQAHLAEAVH